MYFGGSSKNLDFKLYSELKKEQTDRLAILVGLNKATDEIFDKKILEGIKKLVTMEDTLDVCVEASDKKKPKEIESHQFTIHKVADELMVKFLKENR